MAWPVAASQCMHFVAFYRSDILAPLHCSASSQNYLSVHQTYGTEPLRLNSKSYPRPKQSGSAIWQYPNVRYIRFSACS